MLGAAGNRSAPGCQPPPLPTPRGPLSEAVVRALAGPPRPLAQPDFGVDDALVDDDFQLALYCCYELHYRSFRGVDPEWEWWPPLLQFRRALEQAFASALADAVGASEPPADIRAALEAVIAVEGGPSLSAYLGSTGTLTEMREFCVHRSAYQLKEADPHTWAIPRLNGAAKAAMVQIQMDEYGGGIESSMHATLFADTMTALALDPAYGAYLDALPATTLATVNLVSMFGLHRRWRGALVGHLAVFELTSVTPMARYSAALERLGVGRHGRAFYDVHVAADAEHAVIALDRMVAGLVAAEPALSSDVVFGARSVMYLEARFAQCLLDAWASGRTSLLAAL